MRVLQSLDELFTKLPQQHQYTSSLYVRMQKSFVVNRGLDSVCVIAHVSECNTFMIVRQRFNKLMHILPSACHAGHLETWLGTHFYQNAVIPLVIRGPASASRCKALMSALTEWPDKPGLMHVVHCAALNIPWHQEWSMASQLLALCMAPHTSATSTTTKTTESIKIMMSKFQNAAGIQCSSGCIVDKYVK